MPGSAYAYFYTAISTVLALLTDFLLVEVLRTVNCARIKLKMNRKCDTFDF
jgi:hypothetical protein